MQTPEEIEDYVDTLKRLDEQFNQSVLAMVIAAADRVIASGDPTQSQAPTRRPRPVG